MVPDQRLRDDGSDYWILAKDSRKMPDDAVDSRAPSSGNAC
jgi:hypothetical protein